MLLLPRGSRLGMENGLEDHRELCESSGLPEVCVPTVGQSVRDFLDKSRTFREPVFLVILVGRGAIVGVFAVVPRCSCSSTACPRFFEIGEGLADRPTGTPPGGLSL